MNGQDNEQDRVTSLMQGALGKQWANLPKGLQRHYEQHPDRSSHETGWLTISYPRWMQWPLNALRLMGALVNRPGERVPTEVVKFRDHEKLHWRRVIRYEDDREIRFNSYMILNDKRELVEYVNAYLGLRMKVSVEDNKLYYRSCGYLFKLGKLQIPVPEWLALGTAYIEETALEDNRFAMNFQMIHPLFGELFRYRGEFKVKCYYYGGQKT